jgi:hypothetical protein
MTVFFIGRIDLLPLPEKLMVAAAVEFCAVLVAYD